MSCNLIIWGALIYHLVKFILCKLAKRNCDVFKLTCAHIVLEIESRTTSAFSDSGDGIRVTLSIDALLKTKVLLFVGRQGHPNWWCVWNQKYIFILTISCMQGNYLKRFLAFGHRDKRTNLFCFQKRWISAWQRPMVGPWKLSARSCTALQLQTKHIWYRYMRQFPFVVKCTKVSQAVICNLRPNLAWQCRAWTFPRGKTLSSILH